MLREKTHALGERVKELNCLYSISNLFENPSISLEETFQGVVDIIPPSWQYPEVTCGRIIFENKEYKTKSFKETEWKQTGKIIVYGQPIGKTEVYYLEEKPESDEGPFLQEERHLINGITELLGRIIERKYGEDKIKASLKEKEVLLREIHHRVKNNMQLLISLLKLQADKIEDKKYADMFKDGEDRIRSMSLIHEKLYQTQDFANINFGEHIVSLVDGLFVSYGVDTNKVSLNIDIKDVSIDLENAIPCGLIINELVSNSLKYAFPNERQGEIKISLCLANEDELVLTVSDNGIGMPEGLDINNTDSMGLQLVRILAENQLDGRVDINRTEGTQFQIRFKRATYKPRI